MEEVCAPDGRTLAWVVRAGFSPPGVHFVGGPEHPLQLGVNTYRAGEEVRPHIHLSGKKVKTLDLTSGDTIFFVAGGHGIRVRDETRIIEVKQGPYTGQTH